MSPGTWFMAWTLVYAAVLGWAWQALPADGVPLHFGPDGTPDRFGDSGDALTGFALAGVGIGAFMAGTSWLAGSDRIAFSRVNIPHKDYWVHHPSRARAMARDDMALFGAMTMALLSAMVVSTVAAARGHDVGRRLWGTLALYLAVVSAWLVHVLTTRYRPPQEV